MAKPPDRQWVAIADAGRDMWQARAELRQGFHVINRKVCSHLHRTEAAASKCAQALIPPDDRPLTL